MLYFLDGLAYFLDGLAYFFSGLTFWLHCKVAYSYWQKERNTVNDEVRYLC